MFNYLVRVFRMEGSCGRPEFWATHIVLGSIVYLAYYVQANDVKLDIPPIFILVNIIGIFAFILVACSAFLRRAVDARFSDNALLIYFIAPLLVFFLPVFAGLIATPFALISHQLAVAIKELLTLMQLPIQIVLGVFSIFFHIILLLFEKTPIMARQ